MKRRNVLTTTAAIVFAGCLGGGNTGNDGGGGATDNSDHGSGTETTGNSLTAATETTVRSPAEPKTQTTTETTSTATETEATETPVSPISDASTDRRKGTSQTAEAHVTFENDGSRIVVTGTIVGENGCQMAVLDSVRKTTSGLLITVTTERDAPADALCTQALVGIEYRFVVRTETPPESVTVIHRGMAGRRTITTAKPDD